MTTEAMRQQLLAMRAQIDALLAGLTTTPTPTAPAPSTGTVNCQHPAAARETLGGFGTSATRWRCGRCGFTGA